MASWPPKKTTAVSLEVVIRDADGDPVTTGTLSSTLIQDGTATAGPTPTFVTSGDGAITLALTAAQNNFDRMAAIIKSTATGAKHSFISWYNVTRQVDDLAFPATSGRSIQVEADGMVHSDIKEILGVGQSVTDLKDFADAGYDPATNKVQGVVTVDTTTTNTDMVSEPPTTAQVADAVWDELQSGHVTAGTFGAFLDAVISSRSSHGDPDPSGFIDAAISSRSIAGDLMGLTNDAITAAKIATDAVNEIRDGVWGKTFAELAQAIPASTPSAEAAVMLLYMALRSKLDITSGFKEIHNDAGTVIAKKALTDDGTTYSEAKMQAGP